MLASALASPTDGSRLAAGRAADHRIVATREPEHVWWSWLARMGHAGGAPEPAARFETTQLAYEAAASGLGVTLAAPLLSERFIADRRLRPKLGPAVPIDFDYRIVYASIDVERPSPAKPPSMVARRDRGFWSAIRTPGVGFEDGTFGGGVKSGARNPVFARIGSVSRFFRAQASIKFRARMQIGKSGGVLFPTPPDFCRQGTVLHAVR